MNDEAVLFGERIAPNITFARTCITRDMLYSNQVEATNILDDGIKLMIEDREKLKELLMKPSTSRFVHYNMI